MVCWLVFLIDGRFGWPVGRPPLLPVGSLKARKIADWLAGWLVVYVCWLAGCLLARLLADLGICLLHGLLLVDSLADGWVGWPGGQPALAGQCSLTPGHVCFKLVRYPSLVRRLVG